MMNCPNCGRALPAPTVKFCPHCGAACQSAAPEPTYASLREPPAAYQAEQPAAPDAALQKQKKSVSALLLIGTALVALLIVGGCLCAGILHKMSQREDKAESSLNAAIATAFYSFLDDAVIPEYGMLQTDTALNIGDCSGVLSSYVTEDGKEMIVVRVAGEKLFIDCYRQQESAEPDRTVPYDLFPNAFELSPSPLYIRIEDGCVVVGGEVLLTLPNPEENADLAKITVGEAGDDYRRSTYIFHDRTPMRDRVRHTAPPASATVTTSASATTVPTVMTSQTTTPTTVSTTSATTTTTAQKLTYYDIFADYLGLNGTLIEPHTCYTGQVDLYGGPYEYGVRDYFLSDINSDGIKDLIVDYSMSGTDENFRGCYVYQNGSVKQYTAYSDIYCMLDEVWAAADGNGAIVLTNFDYQKNRYEFLEGYTYYRFAPWKRSGEYIWDLEELGWYDVGNNCIAKVPEPYPQDLKRYLGQKLPQYDANDRTPLYETLP